MLSTMWLRDMGGRHGGEADGLVDPGDGGIAGAEEHGRRAAAVGVGDEQSRDGGPERWRRRAPG